MDLECIDKVPSNAKYTTAYVLLDRTNNKIFRCSREQIIKMLKTFMIQQTKFWVKV